MTMLVHVLYLKGWILTRRGNIESGLEAGNEALDIAKTAASQSRTLTVYVAQIRGLLAAIYHYLHSYDKAIEHFQLAAQMQEKWGMRVIARQ